MSEKKNPTNTCGCCEGIEWLTPLELKNDPGLKDLIYRVGTHSAFKESMLRSLSAAPKLRDLTTREDDDPSIALIDAWSVVLDVLTFYQERFINEGYLRSSKERLSLVELAKHISYIPKPGVAAEARLAFRTEEAPGSPLEVDVDAGIQVQSIPGKDELPQIFETLEALAAKTKWNAIRPKTRETQTLSSGNEFIFLKGTDTQLQSGDKLLIVGKARADSPSGTAWELGTVKSTQANDAKNHTQVALKDKLTNTYTSGDGYPKVFALRLRASLFGYNAPDWNIMSDEIQENYGGTGYASLTEWPEFEIQDPGDGKVHLDAYYPKILIDSWVVLSTPDTQDLFQVMDVEPSAQSKFSLSSKTTLVELDKGVDDFEDYRRETAVFAESEALELAERPLTDDISGNSLILDGLYDELEIGQWLILSGEQADAVKVPEVPPVPPSSLNEPEIVSEAIQIKDIKESGGFTELVLEEDLEDGPYALETVRLNANVVKASHGETKSEILGSGDGSAAFQKFTLKQTPLTYIASSSASGADSTLVVRVNDITWKEVSSLYGKGPDEKVYIVRQEDDGSTYVQFGDGITGARLPTGLENVRATYRVGIGFEGSLKAGQLAMLRTPQLNIKSVVNPLPSSGADEPESTDNIREHAPLTVLTLDRVVSPQDFEDFAAAYLGIGKARADMLWKGEDRVIHLTVASAEEGEISDDLRKRLIKAIDEARHKNFQVVVNSFTEVRFGLRANLIHHPDHVSEKVEAAVLSALKSAFDFSSRRFGQGVTPSEVVAIMQGVEGVVAVDLDELGGLDPFAEEHFRLTAEIAQWSGADILPAELLLIDPDDINLSLEADEDQ